MQRVSDRLLLLTLEVCVPTLCVVDGTQAASRRCLTNRTWADHHICLLATCQELKAQLVHTWIAQAGEYPWHRRLDAEVGPRTSERIIIAFVESLSRNNWEWHPTCCPLRNGNVATCRRNVFRPSYCATSGKKRKRCFKPKIKNIYTCSRAASIRCSSPIQLLLSRSQAYLWLSGREAEFSIVYGRS